MRRCKKCLMPDTRPGSIFDENGVCQACLNYEKRKSVDWDKRWRELVDLCDKYRRSDGRYDCIIPVSGGKDSCFQTYVLKEKMGMNPLLVTVGNPFTWTKAGWHNFRNIGEAFNCDHYLFNMNTDMLRRVMRIAFNEFANPLMFVEAAAYTVALKMAVNYDIPLVNFGENPEYEYGTTNKDHYSGNEYVKQGLPYGIFKTINIDYWRSKGISIRELNAFVPPTQEQLNKVRPNVTFLSYFIPWSSTRNLEVARRYGFRDLTHEWKREGYIEDFEQIDSVAYLVHLWLKYPKFGFQRILDVASRYVREGLLSLSEAKELIEKNDYKLDQRALDDFLNFTGYSTKEFWDIVEKFWNRDIFEKVDDVWQLKNPMGGSYGKA